MTKKSVAKIFVLALFIGAFVIAYRSGLKDALTLEQMKAHQREFHILVEQDIFKYAALFFFVYVTVTAISFPGATILTLASGGLFGVLHGTILVSFASSLGATLAFLGARFLFRDFIVARFGQKMKEIEEGFRRDGVFYLLSLRLIPIFPFFLVNLLMSQTPMPPWKFFLVSQIGMLPATIVYVNAGEKLSELDSLAGILTPQLLLSFALIGVLPWIGKGIINFIHRRKVYGRFTRPKSYDYNMVVIGAGAAGLVSSLIAATVRAKVALIENHKMGGDCLNTGCVPSKALIRTAYVAADLKRAQEFGFSKTQVELDFAKVMERVQQKIKLIEPHDSVERYSAMGVECIQGYAKIKSPFEIEVAGRTLTTKNIVIATGAEPFVPPLPGLQEVGYCTSENLWDLRNLPKRLLVLGGGPIGCELAQAFARLGSQVTIIERSPRLLGREDEDVASDLQKTLQADGVQVLLSSPAKSFRKSGVQKIATFENNGQSKDIEFDEVLVALGRKARVTGFGLENLGVTLTKQGTIEVDPYLRTQYPNIFVAGDVAGPYQFTHVASHQAWFSSVNALFGLFKKFKADYRVIPWVTYVAPEIARVGLNETEAKALQIPYEIHRFDMGELDRAIVESEAHGFVKVLVSPNSDRILGVTIVAAHAGEFLAEFTLAMKHGLGLNKILGTIHPYPTFSEANKYAAGVWKRAHQPERLLKWAERYHRFMRS